MSFDNLRSGANAAVAFWFGHDGSDADCVIVHLYSSRTKSRKPVSLVVGKYWEIKYIVLSTLECEPDQSSRSRPKR